MITFLLILILVFVLVDLLVQLVIEPLAAKHNKETQEKLSPFVSEPFIGLVGATMYDGGESKVKKDQDNKTEKKPADK